MQRIDYGMIIQGVENEDTKKLIGSIDVNAMRKRNVEALYYEFPLIERITLEIYKMLPLTDVEYYEQGTMRTIIEILNKDESDSLPDNLIKILIKYFDKDGLRNDLFHVKDATGVFYIKNDIDYEELEFAIMQLISILAKTCGKYTLDGIGEIQLLA